VTGCVPASSVDPQAITGPGPNEARLTGEMIAKETLRYTPAGIPMLDARLMHRCEVLQAGQRRQLEFDIALSFAGPLAHRADGLALGQRIAAEGFLAPRRRQSKALVLNVTRFETLAAASPESTPD